MPKSSRQTYVQVSWTSLVWQVKYGTGIYRLAQQLYKELEEKYCFRTGGSIGLFTGISLISTFEVIFWMGRALVDSIRMQRGKLSFYEQRYKSKIQGAWVFSLERPNLIASHSAPRPYFRLKLVPCCLFRPGFYDFAPQLAIFDFCPMPDNVKAWAVFTS